ncbi:unnamed protein product [Dovyalis caffra]|uniref:Protein-serine/threonine phosphatase n=1 Tax=Dovyalis caffra TaxID=77055 RepID=A0AAV1S8G2_9ROSI|nr:unnamed protein product [Dovyalis caffra]
MDLVINWKLLVLGFIILNLYTAQLCVGESSTCLTVYKEGGAAAVFQSPKCPRWNFPNYDSRPRSTATATSSRCQSALLRGRRKSQEDRTLCALDFRIPFPGKVGVKEVVVGIVAVFDGHNGAEASEMASKLLLEYFALHNYFLLDATYSFFFKKSNGRLPNEGEKDVDFQLLNRGEEFGQRELNFERFKFSLPTNVDDSFHLDILKEALLRAIHDIDAAFSKANGRILAANIGDSKALLCSEKFQSPAEAKATLLRIYSEQRRNGAVSPSRYYGNIKSTSSNGPTHLIVQELTRDHHPDRDDERFRVENAGGYVLEWGGVPRVNGQLAVSRAIGDLRFKSYGVISAPEVTDWQLLTKNDSYLVVASDGMFEKLGLQDACDLLWEVHSHGTERPGLSSSCSFSLAECLVNSAVEKGSMDNVAAVVVPLGSIGFSQKKSRESCYGEGDIHSSTIGQRNIMDVQSANEATSDLVKLEHGHSVTTKFDKLLFLFNYGIVCAPTPRAAAGAISEVVERGAAVYLSGLREKYFGEVFLNASRCLGDLRSDGIKTSLFDEMCSDYDLLETNESVYGLGNSWNFENTFLNKFRTSKAVFEEGLNHIARYVESFESRSNEIWLVFHHEGVSLSKLIYTVEEVENISDREKVEEVKRVEVLQPSKWWHWLKTTKAGNEEMRNLIWQLLMALKSCHDRYITHRDIKPDAFIFPIGREHGDMLRRSAHWEMLERRRIIDFGSAMDEFTLKHLYGSTGPSRAEQTSEYSPPEAFLNASWYHGPTSTNLKYDMWSVGVVMLELILGTPNVFQISARTQALLDPHIVGWNEDLKELAYNFPASDIVNSNLSALANRGEVQFPNVWALRIKENNPPHPSSSGSTWKAIHSWKMLFIKCRNQTVVAGFNFRNAALEILSIEAHIALLFDTDDDRLSVDDALKHPYFQPPPER